MATETEYVLLTLNADGSWSQRQTVKASGAEAAIRKNGGEGTWVAIPARSWQPMQVASVKTERLVLSLMKSDAPESPAAD